MSALLGHLHLRLLRELLHRSNIIALREQQVIPPLEKGLVIQQLPPAEAVTPANWPEALRAVCW